MTLAPLRTEQRKPRTAGCPCHAIEGLIEDSLTIAPNLECEDGGCRGGAVLASPLGPCAIAGGHANAPRHCRGAPDGATRDTRPLPCRRAAAGPVAPQALARACAGGRAPSTLLECGWSGRTPSVPAQRQPFLCIFALMCCTPLRTESQYFFNFFAYPASATDCLTPAFHLGPVGLATAHIWGQHRMCLRAVQAAIGCR